MARRTLVVRHSLSTKEAVARLQALPEKLMQKFPGQVIDLRPDWRENICRFSFVAEGRPVSGSVEVNDSSLEVIVVLPWVATLFWSKIEAAILQEAKELLA